MTQICTALFHAGDGDGCDGCQ